MMEARAESRLTQTNTGVDLIRGLRSSRSARCEHALYQDSRGSIAFRRPDHRVARFRDTDTRIDGKRDRQPGVFRAGRDLLRTVQMDKIETAAAGVRGARPARRIAEIDPLAAAVTTFFGELFLSPSRRRIVMTPSLDDHKLVEACRAGQTEAFGALVQRYQERLYQVLLHLSGSPEDARDVLQDTFLRAYEKLDQFHGDSSFYTWVYRIGVNLALSGHRRRRARAVVRRMGDHPADRFEEAADESADADPTYPLERAEREQIVESALNGLGPEHRAVVILKDFDGRRYEEIGAILNVPIGTVRSRLHRARCELRDRLQCLVEDVRPVRQATETAS
jgi:RNA polymerase sigma-70 factor, ECF subfamily